MRISINHNILSDSPFSDSNKDLFSPPHSATKDLIQDLRNGTPTCYLISGYRGSGKSSFIKRLEDQIKTVTIKETDQNIQKINNDKQEIKTSNSKEVVFVHVNFSSYQSQTFLLRKLIRGLYLKIKDYPSFKEVKSEELKKPLEERLVHLLENLYEKTFYDTTSNITKSDKIEVLTVFNINAWALIKALGPGLIFLFILFNWIYNLIPSESLFNFFGSIASLGVSIKGIVDIKSSITNNKIEQSDFSRKSMFDNEIADYHFFQTLEVLQEKYKVIFVLDELDKVDDDDIDKLLKEMKPYLVSGAATFIAVAGQNLYYKYSQSKSIDDDVLSSIFSKFIHVPLFTREEFQDLFRRLLINKEQYGNQENKLLNHYIDYLIFESKRVPRKFISLIRQNLTWDHDNSYLNIDQTETELKIYSKFLDILEQIDDEEIAIESFDEALHDYFIMQLYIRSHKILFSKKTTFSLNEIFKQNGE